MSSHYSAAGMAMVSRRATIGRLIRAGAAALPLLLATAAGRQTPPAGTRAPASPAAALRVCADPNNLPFSNARGEGFENRIAALIARDLGRPLEYAWLPQRRGFIRNTLNAHRCDVVLGVPAGYEMVATTRPYYRSTYVFVARADGHHAVRSFDDPALRSLRVGIHFTGDDYDNPPAAQALARRNLQHNVVGYSIYGDYSKPNPPAALIAAVASGDVDVAVAWGPLAGYFASREGNALTLTPVTPAVDPPGLRFTFAIAAGVRRGDTLMLATIQRALDEHRTAIAGILHDYGVPLVSGATGDATAARRER